MLFKQLSLANTGHFIFLSLCFALSFVVNYVLSVSYFINGDSANVYLAAYDISHGGSLLDFRQTPGKVWSIGYLISVFLGFITTNLSSYYFILEFTTVTLWLITGRFLAKQLISNY